MKLLTNTITILAEIIGLILCIVWYRKNSEIEPLIGIIATSSALIVSVLLKFASRPRIVLHHRWTHSGRNPQGYTVNNPPVIHVGVDLPDMYWRLTWNYILEIRNNSSFTAYNIKIKYINLPDKTFIEGEFGKIEPFQTHEKREFHVKLIQNVTGNHVDADNYIENNPAILTEQFRIHLDYTDEHGFPFSTVYHWTKDENKFKLFHSKGQTSKGRTSFWSSRIGTVAKITILVLIVSGIIVATKSLYKNRKDFNNVENKPTTPTKKEILPNSKPLKTNLFNSDIKDLKTILVTNGTKYGPCKSGKPNGCWRSLTDADIGDIVGVQLYYHNTSGYLAKNVSLGLEPINNVLSNKCIVRGGILVNGVVSILDSAIISFSEPAMLELIPDRCIWFPSQSTKGKEVPNGLELFSNFGFHVGDVESNWKSQGTITAQFIVKNK